MTEKTSYAMRLGSRGVMVFHVGRAPVPLVADQSIQGQTTSTGSVEAASTPCSRQSTNKFMPTAIKFDDCGRPIVFRQMPTGFEVTV